MSLIRLDADSATGYRSMAVTKHVVGITKWEKNVARNGVIAQIVYFEVAMAQGLKKGSIPNIHFFPHMSLGFTASLP